MQPPATYDFTIYQGATFDRTFTWMADELTPVDLTGCTARMQVRARVAAEDPPLFEASTDDGRITLGDAAGTIDLVIEAADTAAITWKRGVYDMEIETLGGEVTRLLQGRIRVSPEVTR